MTTLETTPHILGSEGLPPSQRVEQFISGKPLTQGVTPESFADADDGVYICPNGIAEYTDLAELPQVVDVKLFPGLQLGAADSKHGVLFGDVDVISPDGMSTVRAAIKPFIAETDGYGESDSDAAIREQNNLTTVIERGFDTYRPLAIAKDGDNTYLITEYRPEIETMDNADWSLPPSDPRYETEVVPNLAFIADSMAKMHAAGIFHGDAQIKNFAKSDTGGQVVVDMEDATITSDAYQTGALLEQGDDVIPFWYAATHQASADHKNVLLMNEPYETMMDEFEHHFLDPYLSFLQEHASAEVLATINLQDLRQKLYDRVSRLP